MGSNVAVARPRPVLRLPVKVQVPLSGEVSLPAVLGASVLDNVDTSPTPKEAGSRGQQKT